ncbi:MAG TPA: acyl-CoA dehydrogenase family protein, partial [Acidimicrobiales bacterium]
NGKKIFGTMAPVADVLLVSVTYPDPRGERYGFIQVPAGTPGVVIHDDWDALGMRTSGSNSVSFHDVLVDASALIGGFPAGSAVGYIERNLSAGAFHAAACLGVAEMAHLEVCAMLRRRSDGWTDGMSDALVADNELDLHISRAALSRAGHAIDDHHADHPGRTAPEDAILDTFSEVQATKAVMSAACMRIVDRALVLSGGSGYKAGTRLARAVGDVRAVMFMNPLSSTRASAWLADRALGRAVRLR